MKISTSITTALLFAITALSCEKEPVPAPATKGLPENFGTSGVSKTGTGYEPTVPGNELLFNPQPEPPARIFEFEARGGRPGGEWTGQFKNSLYKGRLQVKTLSSVKKGRTVHLVQSWTLYPEPIHPPEPVHSPEPVHPPEPVIPPTPMSPVTITLKGIHNAASGILVLNGKQAHVKGKSLSDEGGMLSFGGELMFNPQPEPPAIN